MPITPPSRDGTGADAPRGPADPDEVPVQIDLLRADLYRLLDELVRSRSEYHEDLVAEFERAWQHFKDATLRAG